MRYLIIAISCLVLIGVVFNTNAVESFTVFESIVTEFNQSVNEIRYTFLPNSFKASIGTDESLGYYTYGDETIPIIRYINQETTYNEQGVQIYDNTWLVEVRTLVPGEGDKQVAIRYDADFTLHPDATVFWFPYMFDYYGTSYKYMVSIGWHQYFVKNDSDLLDFGVSYSFSRIGVINAIEQDYSVGDFIRMELID